MREREIALSPNNGVAYVAQLSSYLLLDADTLTARRVLERGGSVPVPYLLGFNNVHGPMSLFESSLPKAVRLAKDTLSYSAFVKNGVGNRVDQFHLMKLRHFTFSAQPARARAAADSLVRYLEAEFRPVTRPAPRPYAQSQRRMALAEAYATLGRAADAARENDQFVTEARRRREGGDYGGVEEGLYSSAYIDVLSGRHDQAIAKLKELAQRPTSGEWISPAVLRADLAWAPLRGRADFKQLIAELDQVHQQSRTD
jgi:hypothetical protein